MIYLNNGATSWPKPSCVYEAVQACLTGTPASQFRGGSNILKKDTEELCRERLGKLLNISGYHRIFFTSGATESMNTLLCGLDFGEEGRAVLATQTEHNSVLRPLMNQSVKNTHPVWIVPCGKNGAVTESALENTLKKATKTTADFAEKNNLLLIADISQSAGCIPVDVDAWNADAVVFTGHKSLFGVQGTGGFYIREGISLKPLKYGGTGRNSQQLTYENGDYEYEVGTQNIPGITGLLAGTEYILQTGLDRIQKKEEMLMELLYEGLKKTDGIQIYGSPEGRRGPVLSMNFDGLKASDAAYILESGYGITVRAGLHCSPLIHQAMGTENGGTVRVSISWFTGEKDIQAFLTAARQIADSLKKAAGSDESL